MALSVLAEVGRMLEALTGSGQAGSIDLRSLPLSDVDREQLETVLGRGEVRAELDIAGQSEVWETSYPGVWWIRHRGAGGKIASEEVSVCRIPEILITHPVDIEAAAGRLREELETTHV
jgi:hydrogenase-1 operon protein HyaF